MRIGKGVEPDGYATVLPATDRDSGLRWRNFFRHIAARDLGRIADLCLKTDGMGFQVFYPVSDENSVTQPNSKLLARYPRCRCRDRWTCGRACCRTA